MNITLNKLFRGGTLLLATAIASVSFVACGGGSGGGPLPPGPGPSITPSPTPTPQVATATGKVVDYDTQSGLGGITVAIGTWTHGATPSPVTTTAPDGTFSFQTQPGSYELRVGSDNPTDTRATLVQHVSLVAGPNALTVATPPPQPNVTPDPVQTSGNFRLKALTADQAGCLQGANQQFASLNAGQFSMDEYIWETQRWVMIQGSASSGVPPMNQNSAAGVSAMLTALYGSASGFAAYDSTTYSGSTPQLAGSGGAKVDYQEMNGTAGWRFGVDCEAQYNDLTDSLLMSDPR